MKKIKAKLFAIILAVTMVFAMTPLGMGQVYADGETTTVEGVVYTLSEDRTATVSGYDNTIGSDVSIPETVTVGGVDYTTESIEPDAFSRCSRLEYITIPASVRSIGENAFWGSGLSMVTFEEGSALISIGNNAFSNCPDLESITVPDSVTSIGANAFYICVRLRNVGISQNVTSIGKNAFCRCTSLESITIPNRVTSIDEGAFSYSGLKTVAFEENSNVTSIGKDAFGNCANLKSITIPASVTSIGDGAFWGCGSNAETLTATFEEGCNITSIPKDMFSRCASLKSIAIPSGVTSIGEAAFNSCTRLGSVTIPSGVTSIGENAFGGCANLKSIEIPASVTTIGEMAFESAGLTNFAIPEGVTTISQGTFINCGSLESVTIPSSVTSIGEGAFYRCTSLESVTIPTSVTSIGAEAFSECTNLKSVEVPASVTTIGKYAFASTGLTNVAIPEGVTTIKQGTFINCESLESVTIPSTVTKIEVSAFENTPRLTTINFLGTKAQWDAITGDGKPTDVTVNTVEDPISIAGASVALSAETFTYNGKVCKPAIGTIGGMTLTAGTDYTETWSNTSSKDVGKYEVTVTGIGKYTGTASAAYQIVPKGTSIKKAKATKKALTVKWKKQSTKMSKSRVTGYQIRYATKSDMSGAKIKTVKGYKKTSVKIKKQAKKKTVKDAKKTSKKTKKLKKKKKYYVQIRTYMTVGGVKYYSPWSKTKTIKRK